MSVSVLHLFEQGPSLRAIGGVALSTLMPRPKALPPAWPGPWIEAVIPPRSEALIRDFVRNSGGDPSSYRGVVPAHLFPQWGFPLAAKTLVGLPYPLTRVVNAGCRIDARAPLPAGDALHVKAQIASIEDDGRRALITQRVVTGTARVPEAIVAEMRVYVPLARADKPNGGAPKQRPTVPARAKEIAFFRVGRTAGRDFAILTGDVNPIHWIRPLARASGFRDCILHGFATLSRAVEALNRRVFAGDARALASIDVRFTRPLVLPAEVGVYVAGNGVWVGDAPGGGAYLEGRFDARSRHVEDSNHG
jgi:acyl dehydratase